MSRRSALALLLLATGAALHAAPVAHAQDLPAPGEGFAWERVGDRFIQPQSLAFGPDGTLWATGSGPYRLDTSAGFPGTWVHVRDDPRYTGQLHALGRGPQGDTLLANPSGTVLRSVDGGRTWAEVRGIG
ncbi:MAG: hypothetical protein R3181_13485, partial [Rubricoccaceae bacterium]|nr:hypothetical protein [Rubricoccaceae bacterium]